jgi:trans-aconitate methyltransferase
MQKSTEPKVAIGRRTGNQSAESTVGLRQQHYNPNGLGLADFFPTRHKRKLLELAEIKPSDFFYDLGCGDASLLIFAVKEYGLKRAIGFENDPSRKRIATKRVEESCLSDRIRIEKEIDDADLSEANVIFDMLPESECDFESFYLDGIRPGTRLLKHDLPLIGFLPDAVDIPFYRMTFPLTRATSKTEWASRVLFNREARPNDVWHELFYYEHEKRYTKWDIRRFQRILDKRLSK